jgi:thiosulfate/3-mercaptopyruvate sulfurtransferase
VRGPLVEAGWLREHLGEVVVVDCQWKLGQPGVGRLAWLEGHVPGAAHLDVDSDLSAAPGRHGRHPLPSVLHFQAAARRAGVGAGSEVVAYDAAGEGGAARLWWLLRHFGHEQAAVLNGGLAAWDGPLARGEEKVEPGDFTALPRRDDTVEAGEVEGHTLLDARAPERFRGEVEPFDPVAGHIPGALNVPFAEVAPGGRFPAPDELRARLAAAAGGDAVAYCGSGITASILVLAAEAAGLPAPRLYPGSWSEWSARGAPAETSLGHEPE